MISLKLPRVLTKVNNFSRIRTNSFFSDESIILTSESFYFNQDSFRGCADWNCRISKNVQKDLENADAIILNSLDDPQEINRQNSMQYLIFYSQVCKFRRINFPNLKIPFSRNRQFIQITCYQAVLISTLRLDFARIPQPLHLMDLQPC